MKKITPQETQKMVTHWLNTPMNGYLGSDYGQDAKSLLQRPFSDGGADNFLQKLQDDVPVLTVMPSGTVNLYSSPTPPDKLNLVIEVAGQEIKLDETK